MNFCGVGLIHPRYIVRSIRYTRVFGSVELYLLMVVSNLIVVYMDCRFLRGSGQIKICTLGWVGTRNLVHHTEYQLTFMYHFIYFLVKGINLRTITVEQQEDARAADEDHKLEVQFTLKFFLCCSSDIVNADLQGLKERRCCCLLLTLKTVGLPAVFY